MKTFREHPDNIAVETLEACLRGCTAHLTDDVGNMLKQVVDKEITSTEGREKKK